MVYEPEYPNTDNDPTPSEYKQEKKIKQESSNLLDPDKTNTIYATDKERVVELNNKGLSLYNLKRYNEAIECYDKILEINPKDANAWYKKGVVLYQDLHKDEEVIKAYDKAIEINPNYALAWYKKGFF